MSGAGEGERGGPYAGVALGLAFVGLAACVGAFVVAPHDNLDEPLVAVLALCVIASSFVSLDVEGSIFWGGAAIPHVCAFALLGPAPAALITFIEEVSVWAVDRYRLRMFAINLFATLAPNMLAARTMQLAPQSDLGYYVLLAAVACGAIALNFFVVTALVGLFYGQPILARYARHRRLAGPIAINVAVAVGAVALYRSAGIGATFFIAGGVLVFAYVVKRVALERDHLAQISRLAESRGALVAQLLETEDRERRVLGDILHDEVIQTLLVTRQDLAETGTAEHELVAVQRLDDVVASLRGAIRATHPSVLDRVGLATALTTVAELYASHGNFRVAVSVGDIPPGRHDRLIFSAARELLANVARHADAHHATLRVSADNGSVLIRVTDDGRGFDAEVALEALADGHIGLASLRERIDAVGGQLRISSAAASDRGTAAEIELPADASTQARREPDRRLASVGQD